MTDKKVSYSIGSDGRFTVTNYNLARPFSGFFPGIAGTYGKPMWAFYVNRAQCICSMGVENKDGAILEFQSANKAYILTNTHGFRTFLKIHKDGADYSYEPFTEENENSLSIGPVDIFIEEKNQTLGMDVSVRYFCVPGEPFSALARELTVKNTSNSAVSIELLDGLPFILPYGLTERLTKDMSHTIQAWMHVVNLEKRIPLYKLKVVIQDKPIVTEVEEGNFYLSYDSGLIPPIVDPSIVFGPGMDLRSPRMPVCVPEKQITEGITPSAMSYLKFELNPGDAKKTYTLVGHTNIALPERILEPGYFNEKLDEARRIIAEIQDNMRTESSSYAFNQYCRNTFLDNILRGGYPVTLQDHDRPVVLHLYSRRHGDVERDYNKFLLKPTYYSQGDGNYRDVCQNRRNDIWFNPLVLEDNIKTFVNLIQKDGYNPLQLKGDHFIVRKVPQEMSAIAEIIKKPFMLGDLLDYIEKNKIKLKFNKDELIKRIVSIAEKETAAEFKEGYWIDHWTYITDLLESYRSMYPDRYWDIFTESDYTFFQSPAAVVPRRQRIVVTDGKIRQYHSVVEKKEKDGPGKVKTTLLKKLLSLIENKFAALDPFGIGIEMEADKPGWYDALNGLPGLFGSSACETFELKRLVLLVKEVLERSGSKIKKLGKILRDLEKGITKAYNSKAGLYHTYFINEVISLKPLKFRQRPLPLFLEAQVHALRLMPGIKKARAVYNAVRKNGLYDEKLKMYKVNSSLKGESIEIGRVKVFSPGWLENESVWVHMEYKYLLELLRNGLYDEFYNDFKDVLLPFQDPNILGRNPLENCSFIVSSAHPDSSLHGVGFLPRLTGATAEFIHMWLWMCIGKEPFFINEKEELNMRFRPILSDWLFTEEGTFSFNMLGTIKVIYHNPAKKKTYGEGSVRPFRIMLDNTRIDGDIVPVPYARDIREKKFKRIDVYLG